MLNHAIFKCPLDGDIPDNMQRILFGMGCFWGVERCFWELQGVYRTAAGYAGGSLENPDYYTVCSGSTGHAEVVEVVYDPERITAEELLHVFWERHDPTQGMRQGNDRGTQYRSMIVSYTDEQYHEAVKTRDNYQQKLIANGHSEISTELLKDQIFYLAEDEHQQYLFKNPQGYCGLAGTGTCF